MGILKVSAGTSAIVLLALSTTAPALAAPKGEPGCALSRMTSEQRDTLGTQIVASAADEKYQFPDEPILQMKVLLDACGTENGWSEKQSQAALEFSVTTVMAVRTLKTMKYSQADAGKMGEFVRGHGLSADAFNSLDDAQAKAMVEAINNNGWAHDKTDAAMQSAVKALVYVATLNDKGKAFTAAP